MKKGFTLVEILIAVSIVALLMSVLVPNFLGARTRARDARRKTDLSALQNSLELYKSDQSPVSYPPSNFMSGLCKTCWSSGASCTGNVYTRKIVCDPQTGSIYIYTRNATDSLKYTLTACLENTRDADRDAVNLAACSTLSKVSYTVNEP